MPLLMEFSSGVALGFSSFICNNTGGGTDTNIPPSLPKFLKVLGNIMEKLASWLREGKLGSESDIATKRI